MNMMEKKNDGALAAGSPQLSSHPESAMSVKNGHRNS
jgi:hypothetical protein